MKQTNPHMFDQVIGRGNGPRSLSYTWRDVALYALGIGAHKKDLPYVYERTEMEALPTFGLIPYLNSVTMNPQKRVPQTPATIVDDMIIEALGGKIPSRLHMAMEMIVYRPINPVQGTFLCEDKVENVYDRGEGKGIAVQARMDVYDVAGRPICTAISTHAIFAFGGYGGQKLPSHTLIYPTRKPDYMVKDHLSDIQAILYRLSGDTYDVHIDPTRAQKYGFKGPYMQGLCSYGFACRMGIEAVCPGEPEQMVHMYAQMRNVCYPNTDICFIGWNMGAGQVYFRLLDNAGNAILDNGLMVFKDL